MTCTGKGYLASIEDLLRVSDMLVTELMLGHQPLHTVVELYNAAIGLDPHDNTMRLQARLGILIARNGREFGCNKGFLQGH